MPWKECNIVEERLRFIARLLDGEKMSGLCREFGIEHWRRHYNTNGHIELWATVHRHLRT